MIIYTILIYLCIALICNAVYFFASNGNFPECGTLSMIFVNIAILCQILPTLLKDNEDEKNQKNGIHLISVFYLIAELFIASISILNNSNSTKALSFQIILLGMYLIVTFGIKRADIKTNKTIQDSQARVSSYLSDANNTLRIAILECETQESRDILREIYSVLNAIPMSCNENCIQIDIEIYENVKQLCQTPNKQLQTSISRLINKRKIMSTTLSFN